MSRNYLHPSRLSVFPLSIVVNIELVRSKEKLCRCKPSSTNGTRVKEYPFENGGHCLFYFLLFFALKSLRFSPSSRILFLSFSLFFFSFSKAIRDLEQRKEVFIVHSRASRSFWDRRKKLEGRGRGDRRDQRLIVRRSLSTFFRGSCYRFDEFTITFMSHLCSLTPHLSLGRLLIEFSMYFVAYFESCSDSLSIEIQKLKKVTIS